jgi:signal transduction histidine kinase
MASSIQSRDRIRTGIITTLLVLSLMMIGLLSQQTYKAMESREELTAGVLKDYAALAADELVRRNSAVSFFGFYPLLGRVARVPLDQPLPRLTDLPHRLEFRNEEEQERFSRATRLGRSLYRYHPASRYFEQTGDHIPAQTERRLLAALNGVALSANRTVGTFHVREDGQDFNFLYLPIAEQFFIGLWVDDKAMLEWLEFFVNREPLLPQSLVARGIGADAVFIKVWTKGGVKIFEQGDHNPDMRLVTREFDEQIPGLFGGLTVAAGINPQIATELIIGGLPGVHVPILGGSTGGVLGSLWAFTTLMIVMAIVLLRRERALARMRTDFVSRVSHELRTPLAQILMFAQTLLLDRVRTEEERKRSLTVIDKEARRLSHLVENILQFARGERGSAEVCLAPTPLPPLVREVADQFRPMMRGGNLRVASTVTDDTTVDLDPGAFQQMLLNLLDNAVKYNPAGDVDVSVSAEDGERIALAVEDRGPGVPSSEQDRIWEPYYRTGDDTNAAAGGTGIGLAVVRELARLHRAVVTVADRDGGGARFVIGFKLSTDTAG